DIRVGSPTFGEWAGYELTEENHRQLWIPPGFAHGFCVLSDIVDFTYKCTDLYSPDDEGGILWNDAGIGIPWPITSPNLSVKDQAYPTLSDTPEEKLPVYSL
ncbi:dTDP-4-dehydrorhamnose 3,5-epimerase family protein, partial [Pseudomonadota bacterium]